MFNRWILASSLFILEIVIVRTIDANSLPTADPFSSQLRVPSVAAVGDVDEDDDYSLVVTRGNEILTSTQTETGHYREITVTLTAFNETFVLDLKLNAYLFASSYIEKAITNSGEIYNDVNHVTGHCYYTGEVRNKSQSSAAVSTCKGITGYFAIGNVSYHIEPKGYDLYGRHRVFRDRDDVKSMFRCGSDGQPTWMSTNNLTDSFGRSIHRIKRSFPYPQDADRIDKVVEVYVANDNSQYRARSSNVQDVYRRTKEIVNVASLAYQALGIYLVLVGTEVWTDSDRFTIRNSNVNEALSSWYTYRKNSVTPSHYNDNGVLITNVAFDKRVVGLAVIGSMCSNQFSGSIISDLSSQAAPAGTTLAHEMGHNFGLVHDGDQCSCDDSFANNRCIMYAYSSSNRPSTKWSSCSKTQIAISFSEGLDICLYNIPPTIFQPSPTCGNGIIEDGEQCDCGNAPSSECNSACCNSATCQLAASAACASGRCCDTSRCQIKSSGTECRSKSNDCDLSESCNGVDARCPTDSYKPDGTDCTNIESAYCYQGQCRSHKSQCELIWGPGTQVSDNLCYTRFNGAGAHYGNCGIRWTNTGVDYISCNVKDVVCGKLQCQDTSKALFYYQNYYSLSQASIGSYSCHSVIFDFGIGTQDPGLVPNGARCGDRQMCVNQKCVDITALPSSIATTITSTTPSTTTSTTTASTTTTKSTTTTSTSTSSATSTTPQTSTSPTTKASTPASTTSPTTSMKSTTPSTTTTSPTTPTISTTTPTIKTSTTNPTTPTIPTTTSTTKTSITSTTTDPTKSIRSTTMSTTSTANSSTGYANEGAFGVHLGRSQTGVLRPLHLDGALANRLSRYNFSIDSFRSSLISVSQFVYTEICAGVLESTTAQLRTTGAYPPLSFDWMSTAQNGVDSGCRGGVLSVSRIVTISISQNGGGVYSSRDKKETSWSMFSVTDTMKYEKQLLCVFGARSSSAYGTLPFSSPLVNPSSPVQLYNAATTAYKCSSDAPAYFFSMSVGVPAGKTATVQLVISGMNYTFEMTRQNTRTTGTTTLGRTVLVPCTSEARMVLVDGEVVPGSNLISFTAFPYELKTGTSVSWAGYRTRDLTNPGTITYDLWLVRKEINFQVENSVVQIPVNGYYYIYTSAGVCNGKPLSLSVRKNDESLFGLTRTATDHNGIDTIGHGMVVLLSENDQLRVSADADTTACSSNIGLHTSFIGILLYRS